MRKNSTIAELLDRTTGERKYLNAEERQAFFDATTYRDVDVKFYCRMLYYTGCRRNEALNIRPKDIDYSEKVVWIQTLKQKPGKPLPRYVELPDQYLEGLHNVYDVMRNQKTKCAASRIWGFTDRTA